MQVAVGTKSEGTRQFFGFPKSRSCEFDGSLLRIVDQRKLPHEIRIIELDTFEKCCNAISTMEVRGAPLIGVVAAYGMYYALKETLNSPPHSHSEFLKEMLAKGDVINGTRPTAANLAIAVKRILGGLASEPEDPLSSTLELAQKIENEEVVNCSKIGEHGLQMLKELYQQKGRRINVLTHCNAGFLGCVEFGTVTAPMYFAHREGIPIHVYVSETRPRNQGALTSWELTNHGVPNTYIVDNAAGLLMAKGHVDICFVGADRVASNGDVANKIGTYMKGVAACVNKIPFYSVLTKSAIDFSISTGEEIIIEERASSEVVSVRGKGENCDVVRVTPFEDTKTFNPGFDVTPARFLTALLTEEGLVEASKEGLLSAYPQEGGCSK